MDKSWSSIKFIIVYSLLQTQESRGYQFTEDEGFLESCDFEAFTGTGNRDCFWYSSDTGVVDWMLTNQPLQVEANAGLTADHTPTGNGYYWVARRTGSNYAGNRAFLEKLVRGGESKLMNIWYHMSGDVGSLTVELLPLGSSGLNHTSVFSIQGNQARFWQKTPDIPIADCEYFRIRIEAQLKGLDTSIAIDDIEFRADGRIVMEPSPTVPRDEVCWNDGNFILSTDQHHHHHCCCAPGFAGVYCQMNIDECVTENGNNLCAAGSTCLDLVDGFSCRCKPGFTGMLCDINIDECRGVVCERGGSCEDLENDYRCRCPGGYEGKRCEKDVDDCIGVLCQNGGTCIDRYNSFVCDCLPGFEGNLCNIDINECLTNPCGAFGSCINAAGTYWCVCPAGLQNIDDGQNCAGNYDSCISHPCLYGSTCVDKPIGFDCHCRAGTTGNLCEVNVNECENVNCLNGGVCNDGLNSFTCDCMFGFTGPTCEIDMRAQMCDMKCDNSDTCNFETNETVCVCNPGYTGSTCQYDINECNPSPCVQGICRDPGVVAEYICDCSYGWRGKNCDEVDDFCSISSCSLNSTCYNTPHGAMCVCDAGYTGALCEQRINPCDRVRCLNGGQCMQTGEYNLVWNCECPMEFVGKYCETEVIETTDGTALMQAQQTVCMDFWSLPKPLKASVLAVSIVILVVILVGGAIGIECGMRLSQHKQKSKPLMYQYPFKFNQ